MHTERQFLAIPERNFGRAIRIPASNLLPLGEVFQRRPIHDFWSLTHLKSFAAGKTDCFLSDPRRIRFGPLPFRFESEGELVYFMRHYDLQFPAFLISHAEHRINRPDWFKS